MSVVNSHHRCQLRVTLVYICYVLQGGIEPHILRIQERDTISLPASYTRRCSVCIFIPDEIESPVEGL
jgi:hypothetical protein